MPNNTVSIIREGTNYILLNPRIIYILRNEEGNILNENSVGRFYEEIIDYIDFNKNITDIISNLKIDTYNYRQITFKSTDIDGSVVYVQLLVNVDSEQAITQNFFKVLTFGTGLTIILAIIASYLLSKRALKLIIDNWNKQMEFVQNASHELRTPLTIIQAKQELLKKEPNSTILDKDKDIDIILSEIENLTKLINDLLLLAKPNFNNIEVNKTETDIDELISEIAKTYQERANSQEKELKMNLKFHKKLLVDSQKISQLIRIVLDNSLQYTSKNDVIEIYTFEKMGRCWIEIKDTGKGISNEEIKNVFEHFYKEDKSRNRQNGGTGLGLSIAKWIVDAHDGNIRAKPNIPKGTIISIKLNGGKG